MSKPCEVIRINSQHAGADHTVLLTVFTALCISSLELSSFSWPTFPHPTAPGNHNSTVSVCSASLDSLQKHRTRRVFVFLCLTHLTWHNAPKAHPCFHSGRISFFPVASHGSILYIDHIFIIRLLTDTLATGWKPSLGLQTGGVLPSSGGTCELQDQKQAATFNFTSRDSKCEAPEVGADAKPALFSIFIPSGEQKGLYLLQYFIF